MTSPVKEKFDGYPKDAKQKLLYLRNLILEAAEELDYSDKIEETLKWGEPSYVSPHGSTIRMDWKAKSPDTYAIYFKCTSKLVPTFKQVYGDLFDYEKNRAIHFRMDQKQIPVAELKECIKSALRYHKVKNKAYLGMVD